MNYNFKQDISLKALILLAFQEDSAFNDISALSSINNSSNSVAEIKVKQNGIFCGIEVAELVAELYSPNLKLDWFAEDGDEIIERKIVGKITGKTQEILSVERTLLNFIQRMSGVATLTNKYVKLIEDTEAIILDTRKTIPGFRMLDKYAVKIGRGNNHRFRLDDMVMLKDNHIAASGSITKAVAKVVNYFNEKNIDIPIEVETKNLDEVREALNLSQVQRIMFDNFNLQDIREGVQIVKKQKETEASGGINMATIRSIAETGVQFISVGAITHSATSLDISLDILQV